ncbi:D-alanyl-D-alanine carboxypeptidase [Candidatus Saccharibacteria bacterium]|nr:D-alanyl-D-alanine carboxypeptidase [Candidatus Saccharibacteria bacterium]
MPSVNRVNYDRYEAGTRKAQRRMKECRFKLKHPGLILALVILALVSFRMATLETDLDLVTTVEIPEGVVPDGLGAEVTGVKWAAAVDGKVVRDDIKVQPTASTTKMILSLAVLEKKPLSVGEKGPKIKITNEMYDIWGWYLNNDGSNTKVEINEEISEYDALVSVMLASSNNMADSLAIWAFGSIEEYQKYATEMLKRMGVANTTLGIKDASGYDSSTTSTASDLARIGYFVMNHPVLAEIVALEKAEVPVAGEIRNTNKLLGKSSIAGIKTGFIGDESGYCVVTGYRKDEHIVTVAVLGAATRDGSFDNNLIAIKELQSKLVDQEIFKRGDTVGYYESWWTGKVPVTANESFSEVNYKGAEHKAEILVNDLKLKVGEKEYEISLTVPDFRRSPSLVQRFLHVFGWKK